MDRRLLKSDRLEIEGRRFPVRYYEGRTARGTRRFSAEIELAAGDCIILDADTLPTLESKVARLAPATILSRHIAATSARTSASPATEQAEEREDEAPPADPEGSDRG